MSATALSPLPKSFTDWFASRQWQVHAHQLAMLEAAKDGKSALLMAPTGGGKTLAGFLPSLVSLAEQPRAGLHSLYISPLKALTADIARNLHAPVSEMGLDISIATRTGDTKTLERRMQRQAPPNLWLTTPESLSLLLSYEDAPRVFADLQCVIVDELHALANNKRGQLLALAIARLKSIAPQMRAVGLSATAHNPDYLAAWLGDDTQVVRGAPGPPPSMALCVPESDRLPWSGHMALRTMPEVYEHLTKATTAIVFVNTRAQAELTFQELWRLNEDGLAIGIHHGSLDRKQREKTEAAMAAGHLQAVVATSSLDLGIDWGAVDLVIQVGAPKGVSRLLQRIGRSNHRFDQPSEAVLVPGNRFEALECLAAMDGVTSGTLDGPPEVQGGLDVLAQHFLGTACSEPVDRDALFEEVTKALPYRNLGRKDFDDVVEFVSTGGYALKAYDKFAKLTRRIDGRLAVSSPAIARSYRMNVGTIVEANMLKVRVKGGPTLGEIEEYFAQMMVAGDTFIFSGRLLEFVEIRQLSLICRKPTGPEKTPKVPTYMGGRLGLSTNLSGRVREMLQKPQDFPELPEAVREWIDKQREFSVLPKSDELLVETFPRSDRHYLVAYCFEGWQAHQTLGMLLTKRMERMGYGPIGFVGTDYVIGIWSVHPVENIDNLFDQDMLGDDLESWMADSSMLKRTFRNCATIAGLIEKNSIGGQKTQRQVTFNTDLIYDTLRSHQPDHILLRATRQDAATGLTDVGRLADFLVRIQSKIHHKRLERVSPLAVPVLLEIGRESVYGDAIEDMLAEAEEELVRDAYNATQPSAA